jgi:small subunit ribosomal protein S13
MPRIAGFDIPDQKKIRFSLRYIHGIGPKRADDILALTKIDPDKRAHELTGDEINKIAQQLERFTVGGQLRRVVRENIERLKRINSYRGIRHRKGLPVRGQRTRTNARTNRGKRKTVGAITKSESEVTKEKEKKE